MNILLTLNEYNKQFFGGRSTLNIRNRPSELKNMAPYLNKDNTLQYQHIKANRYISMRNKGNEFSLKVFILMLIPLCHCSNSFNLTQITNCSWPLLQCPKDRMYEDRELCMNRWLSKCSFGHSYLCGVDSEKKYIIETCQHTIECPPGTSLTFLVLEHNDSVRIISLECLVCEGKTFETNFIMSNMSSHTNGCSYVHKEAYMISEHLVLQKKGTPFSPNEWYCDVEHGFYERGGWLTCDDLPSHPCHCSRKDCGKGNKLRPDGLCIRCHTNLDPDDNWRCAINKRRVSSLTDATNATMTTIKKPICPGKENAKTTPMGPLPTSVPTPNTTAVSDSVSGEIAKMMLAISCIILLFFIGLLISIFQNRLLSCFSCKESFRNINSTNQRSERAVSTSPSPPSHPPPPYSSYVNRFEDTEEPQEHRLDLLKSASQNDEPIMENLKPFAVRSFDS